MEAIEYMRIFAAMEFACRLLASPNNPNPELWDKANELREAIAEFLPDTLRNRGEVAASLLSDVAHSWKG